MPLYDLIGHCPLIGGASVAASDRCNERRRVTSVLPAGSEKHQLGTGVQAIKPSPYRAGLAEPALQRFGTVAALPTCYCPLRLSPPGGLVDPRIPSESVPTGSGILCRVTRRTAALNLVVEGTDALADPAPSPEPHPRRLNRVAQGVTGLQRRDVNGSVGYDHHAPPLRGRRPRRLRRETALPGSQRIPRTAATSSEPSSLGTRAAARPAPWL